MNAGLSNLATLKAHLLAPAIRTQTALDTVIADLGLGVAAQFERFCNRKFYRAVGATMTFPAGADNVIVDRYPVESIAKVEVKENATDGFIEDANAVENWRAESGWVSFGSPLSTDLAIGRITFTGGYWWETKEPADQGYSTTPPTGAASLPDDLKLAWLMQCRHVWAAMDKLGVSVGAKPDAESKLGDVKLTPQVVEILNAYRRFAIA
jgi:hypothetical protein